MTSLELPGTPPPPLDPVSVHPTSSMWDFDRLKMGRLWFSHRRSVDGPLSRSFPVSLWAGDSSREPMRTDLRDLTGFRQAQKCPVSLDLQKGCTVKKLRFQNQMEVRIRCEPWRSG